MYAITQLVGSVIELYIWIIILQVVLSWLVAFNVVNTRNRFVYVIGDVLYRLTEPVLGPIRRFLPSFGGIDLSPVVLILLLVFLKNLIVVDLAYLAG
ncbi:MAG: YggT family protein [Alphaproteobacteria bacterium]|nr:YggT family protein [Alphaproteobacteria bacterium]